MPFKIDNHRKSDSIKITHYVNPHKFWFKYEIDVLFEREYILGIDQKLEYLTNGSKNHVKYSPSIGEIVILRYCFGDIDKWIRARVDCEYKYKRGSEFTLWAIDEGYPIRSSLKWIRKLQSVDLANENPFIFKGTLNQVVPATMQYNMIESASEMVKTKCWSEKAVNEIEKIISDATTLIFHYDSHAAKQHLLGSVESIAYSGTSTTLNDVLKSIDEAVDCSINFEQEYLHLTQKDYWDQVQQNFKIKENGKHSIPHQNVKVVRKKPTKDILEKMNDWEKRNRSFLPMKEENKDSLSQPIEDREKQSSTPQLSSWNLISHLEGTPNTNFKKVHDIHSFSTKKKQNVLIHCPEGVFVNEIKKIEESNFTKEVQDELTSKGFKKPVHAQAVSWPLLMRTHSLILVNSTRTAKTWTYLPAVCSLISESHSDNKIVQADGPVMIIICLNSSDVDKVVKRCRSLLKHSLHNFTCEAAYGEHNKKYFQNNLVKGIDILVTTCPCLLGLMAGPLEFFNKKRITTIVFDEIDSMCVEDVDKIYNKFFTETTRIQVIITSKTWTKVLEKFSQRNDILLYIGTCIEAAIYSNMEITLQTVSRDDHFSKFLKCFKTKPFAYQHTVVICNANREIKDINEILRSEGISISSKAQEVSRLTTQNQFDDLGVIVCTDDMLRDLNIRHAQNIIHYSLPCDWIKFTERFVASVDYYENLVQDGFPLGRPTSLIFTNENSNLFPRLIDFMENRCLAEVPEGIIQLTETFGVSSVDRCPEN